MFVHFNKPPQIADIGCVNVHDTRLHNCDPNTNNFSITHGFRHQTIVGFCVCYWKTRMANVSCVCVFGCVFCRLIENLNRHTYTLTEKIMSHTNIVLLSCVCEKQKTTNTFERWNIQLMLCRLVLFGGNILCVC